MAMLKRNVKALAVSLSEHRPSKANKAEFQLWLAMCRTVAKGAVPMVWAEAFEAACTNHGIWTAEYEQ